MSKNRPWWRASQKISDRGLTPIRMPLYRNQDVEGKTLEIVEEGVSGTEKMFTGGIVDIDLSFRKLISQ